MTIFTVVEDLGDEGAVVKISLSSDTERVFLVCDLSKDGSEVDVFEIPRTEEREILVHAAPGTRVMVRDEGAALTFDPSLRRQVKNAASKISSTMRLGI